MSGLQNERNRHSMTGTERLRGVFSSQEVRSIGTGTTSRKTIQKVFWFVEQDDDGGTTVQPLNTNYIPTGSKKSITMEELLEKYAPEPEFYVQSVFPKMRELDETVDRADHCRAKGETYSAEYEYDNALDLDVENVRANFGIGLTYLARGESDKAENIFERLVHLEAAFQEEHKHLFNDFGINLRKNKMYTQAKDYYARALELTTADDNLHINMARALMELQEYLPCTEHLLEALKLDPGNEMAVKFLEWLEKRKLVPPEMRRNVAAVLAGEDPSGDNEDEEEENFEEFDTLMDSDVSLDADIKGLFPGQETDDSDPDTDPDSASASASAHSKPAHPEEEPDTPIDMSDLFLSTDDDDLLDKNSSIAAEMPLFKEE